MENVEYEIGYYHDYASIVAGVLVTRSCAHIGKEESVLCQSRVSEQNYFLTAWQIIDLHGFEIYISYYLIKLSKSLCCMG